MYPDRVKLYNELESRLGSKLLVYVTSDRQGFESQINGDVIDFFINQLDNIGVVEKLSLYLYTRGGNTATAWNIVNLLQLYCDHLQVVVPHKAHSAGTLISIGANSIIMTKQATLSPIDPSVNNPLNPQIPTMPQQTFPVSVEAVKGYLSFAKEELAIKDENALSQIMIKLSDSVHPLVLGEVYRTQAQIKMLAEKLLANQITDNQKIQQISSFLCSDSGSHDYTINRREARDKLGLCVDIPDDDMYNIIKSVYVDIEKELGLGQPFDLNAGTYAIKRVLLESVVGGSDYFLTEGVLRRMQLSDPNNPTLTQQIVQDNRTFEGWKHEPSIV